VWAIEGRSTMQWLVHIVGEEAPRFRSGLISVKVMFSRQLGGINTGERKNAEIAFGFHAWGVRPAGGNIGAGCSWSWHALIDENSERR
jgi:hypothetical protein